MTSQRGVLLSGNLNSSFSGLTGARQTMMSWAKYVDSFEAVPEIYKIPYQTLVGNTSTLPYTVLAPAQDRPRSSKSVEKLLCEIGETFYVLERSGSLVATTGFPYPDIYSLEVGNIILYSWFTFHGRTITGTEATLTVEFNEATLRHFAPFFTKMRSMCAYPDQYDLKAEQAKFDWLSEVNFKYMNFGRQSLVPGERVIQTVFQPSNRHSILNVLGHRFYRINFLAHLTILTDQEVILIGEAERFTEKERSPYGGIRHYLTRCDLVCVELEELPDDLLRLTFRVSPDFQVERLFEASRLHEVEHLKKALESLNNA
jgi:hypothetical protein